MTSVINSTLPSFIEAAPIKARTGAVSQHTARVFTAMSALSVGYGEDAQVVLSPMWRKTSSGTYVTNSPKNTILVKVRNGTIVKACFSKSRYSATNASGKKSRVRPGYVGKRHFTSDIARGSFTAERPVLHAGNVGSIGFDLLDGATRFVEWMTLGPGDAGATTGALASMTLPEDNVESEAGMTWELTGFVTNAGAVFDLVSILQMPFRVLELGDSNDGGYTAPTAGGESYILQQARTALVTGAISLESFSPVGAEAQWLQLVLRAFCSARNLSLDVGGNVHGGAWQGVMGATTRSYIVDSIWPGCYQDLADRWLNVFHGDTPINDPAHWTGGTWRPQLVAVGSFVNDSIRALIELFQSGGFPLDSAFRGATHQASVKALVDEILTTFAEARALVHTGVYDDLGLGSNLGVPYVDTMSKTRDACCAGSPNGRGFRNNTTPGTEDSVGLMMPLSDYSAQTGISKTLSLGAVHFTEAQHLAMKNAVYSAISTWLDSALGIVFVDATNGNDGNAGTFAAPKKTISGAGSSWTYLALSGTFAETLTIGAHGTQYAPKTVFRYGSTASVTAINTNSKNYVFVHGVTATGSTGFAVATGTGIRLSHVTASGCSTAGAAISGGTVTVEHSTFTGCGIGLNMSGSATVTGRRNTYTGNVNGAKTAGTVTFNDDGSHLMESSEHGVYVTAGTVRLTNCKLATLEAPSGSFLTDLFAAVMVTGGQANIYNCHLHNANTSDAIAGGEISYCIRATGSGLVQWKNCVFTAVSNVYATYVWLEAVGASGNLVAASNNAYQTFDSPLDVKFAVGATLLGATQHTYASTWSSLTNRSGTTIESGSSYGQTGITCTGTSDIVADRPTTSNANGIGADLSATFTRDYFRVTRSGTWDAGPWII